MDSRCLRLFPAGVRAQRHRAGIQHPDYRGYVRHLADIGDAAGRRILIRARSRPLGAPTHPDGQHSIVFVHRIRVRLRAKPHSPARAARHIRHCNGRRMGRRRVTHHGIYTAARQRFCVGLAAIGLSDRILPGVDRLRRAVPVHRMARHVHGWGHPGARRSVPESPSWKPTTASSNTASILKSHWRLGIYAVLLMTAFNFFSHGTQDFYPTFLQVQHGFGPHEVGLIAVIYNVGAIIGGISFGSLSERFGRRRIIIIAAVLSLVVLPLWAFAASAVWLAIGAFLMQVMVQGAWGVIPVHLNELSPDDARGTFPGFVYQLGNLIASFNATLEAGIAAHYGGNYALALAIVAGTVAVAIRILTAFGIEAKGVAFGTGRSRGPADPKTAVRSYAI